ncbi:recombinase [Epibacterium ulvae]|uniref:recombinase n=1 Tax=Epibacterium ulvae TaxID=1156985 RepID=UPI001BFC5F3D|nr:recombinase [Epibacterium ulvae]MBT8152548.1 recombinase [Epibacterium ulvae]
MKHPPETLIGKTADLLRSLHDSILTLRNEAEALREQLRAEDAINPDTGGVKPQINKLETLIRDCQKVEKTLVDQSALITDASTQTPAYDFEAVRVEINSRLARLRATQPGGGVPE